MKRLAESASNELVRTALRSGRADQPSDRARQRTALALGVGAAVGAGVGAAATTARAAQAVTAATGAGSKAAATGSVAHTSLFAALRALPLATKILTLGIAAGALATGTVMLEQRASRSDRPVSSSSPIAPESSPSAQSNGSATKVAELPSTPPREVSPAPSNAGAAGPVVQASAKPETRPSASSDDLSEGVSVLELARTAIAEGDTARALRIVNEYERQFPKGDLREEAAAIRIEALIASGRDTEALDAATKFLAASPNSPHARHVRAMAASLRESHSNP